MEYRLFKRDELKYVYRIYENGYVENDQKRKEVKPYSDKRTNERPFEPPTFYAMGCDGKRRSYHFNEVVAEAWFPEYTTGCKVWFKDGNAKNCAVNNLMVFTPMKFLREVIKSDKMWKPVVVDEPTFYEYFISEDGELFNGTTYELVKPFIDNRDDHYRYTLYLQKTTKTTNKKLKKATQQKSKHYSVNRLVASAFLGIPQDDSKEWLVYYRNGDQSNNHYSNLSWGTRMDKINNTYILSTKAAKPIGDDLCNEYLGEEIWRPIVTRYKPRYSYEVSNFGRVRDKTNGVELKYFRGAPNPNNQSHLTVSIFEDGKGYHAEFVHILVARSFVLNRYPEHYNRVNHINGNPECNWAINLEWCTHAMNIRHAFDTNLNRNVDYTIDRLHPSWQALNIIAWTFGIEEDIDKAYQLYDTYAAVYLETEDGLHMSKNEYIDYCNRQQLADPNFKKLVKFYHSNYKNTI